MAEGATPPHDSLQEKLAWARERFAEHGETLLADPDMHALLSALRDRARDAARALEATGVVAACRRCEEEDGGSCCARGIERHYDAVLFLVNLLLLNLDLERDSGAGPRDLPERRRGPSDCLFLGERGCILPAKQVICVNYLCAEVVVSTKPDALTRLRAKEGEYFAALEAAHARVRGFVIDRS